MLNKQARPWHVWIVSGPSGSGKTTLVGALLKDSLWSKRLIKSVSCTTRPKRSGEKEGLDYYHMSAAAFAALLKKNGFLESENIFGFSYGTPKKIMRQAKRTGRDLILCIDVKGARTVRRFFKKNATSIFIVPPGLEALKERLKKRQTEDKKDIEKRLKRVKIELLSAREYDYIVVNDDFRVALGQIKSILTAQRCAVA